MRSLPVDCVLHVFLGKAEFSQLRTHAIGAIDASGRPPGDDGQDGLHARLKHKP